jgi:glycerophosphoryl diester phosphodiesterase
MALRLDASSKTSAPMVIAHRGASRLALENTAAAFELAIDLGAEALELDVQMTPDGELIVRHDDIVVDRSVEQWALTLADALGRFGSRIPLFIDLKRPERHPQMIERLLDLLRGHPRNGAPHRVLAADVGTLIKLDHTAPEVPLVQLLPHRGPWPLGMDEIARYARAVSPLWTVAGTNLIAAAKLRGIEVYPHTVNDPQEMMRLFERGVDGIISDDPERLSKVATRDALV